MDQREKYSLKLRQIHLPIWTNVFCSEDKYHWQWTLNGVETKALDQGEKGSLTLSGEFTVYKYKICICITNTIMQRLFCWVGTLVVIGRKFTYKSKFKISKLSYVNYSVMESEKQKNNHVLERGIYFI